MTKKAVVLVSGGLDSVTVLGMVKSQGYEIFPLTIMYSQRNKVELEKAKLSVKNLGINNHKVFNIDLSQIGGSALTDYAIDVPKYEKLEKIPDDIPVTYVPARNTIFLSIALGYAETVGAYDIFIGAHVQDSANYPDCRPEYINEFQRLANFALGFTQGDNKVRIHAPLIEMSKADIIRSGVELGIDYSNTISCYDPTEDGLSCGKCLSCSIRLDAFAKLNMKDPSEYV